MRFAFYKGFMFHLYNAEMGTNMHAVAARLSHINPVPGSAQMQIEWNGKLLQAFPELLKPENQGPFATYEDAVRHEHQVLDQLADKEPLLFRETAFQICDDVILKT